VLEEQRFEPLGSGKTTQVDVRVIAATNKHLEDEITAGNFREDLFYRLNVIPFYVPALRDRAEDIPLLADYFVRHFASEYGRRPKQFTPDAYSRLRDYTWPGNVRELRNLMERIVIMNPQERIGADRLPLPANRRAGETGRSQPPRFETLEDARKAYEREYVLKTLEGLGGNVTRAAESLGLERSHLYRKMKALGISPKES
jgi:two-component system, NtrC family, nitrogen regulation response regulator NtrX